MRFLIGCFILGQCLMPLQARAEASLGLVLKKLVERLHEADINDGLSCGSFFAGTDANYAIQWTSGGTPRIYESVANNGERCRMHSSKYMQEFPLCLRDKVESLINYSKSQDKKNPLLPQSAHLIHVKDERPGGWLGRALAKFNGWKNKDAPCPYSATLYSLDEKKAVNVVKDKKVQTEAGFCAVCIPN